MEQLGAFLHHMAAERGAARNTLDAYRNDLAGFVAFAAAHRNEAPPTIYDLDHALIRAYVRSLETDHGYAAATVARKIAALKSFCRFLLLRGDLAVNPATAVASPRERRPAPRPMTAQQVELLLGEPLRQAGAHAFRDAAILELMYATGLRVTELTTLDLDDVQLLPEPGYVYCAGTGARERTLPLSPRAVGALRRYLETRCNLPRARSQAALFVSQSGKRLARQWFWHALRTYAQAAGIAEPISPQMLRQAFAANALRSGASVEAVQELLGHAYDSTSRGNRSLVGLAPEAGPDHMRAQDG